MYVDLPKSAKEKLGQVKKKEKSKKKVRVDKLVDMFLESQDTHRAMAGRWWYMTICYQWNGHCNGQF